jgi:hypothetical protein
LRMSMADKETLLKTHHKIWTDSGFGKWLQKLNFVAKKTVNLRFWRGLRKM